MSTSARWPGPWTTARACEASTRQRPAPGGLSAPWGRCPKTRTGGRRGRTGPPGSRATGRCSRTQIRTSRSARSRLTPRRPGSTGTRHSLPCGRRDGQDLRGLSDGQLLMRRGQYERETAWAPQWVGDQLQRVRTGADDAEREAVLSSARAEAARKRDEHDQARLHDTLAGSQRAMAGRYPGAWRRSSLSPWRPGGSGKRPPGNSGTTPWPRKTSTCAGIRTATSSRCGPPSPSR